MRRHRSTHNYGSSPFHTNNGSNNFGTSKPGGVPRGRATDRQDDAGLRHRFQSTGPIGRGDTQRGRSRSPTNAGLRRYNSQAPQQDRHHHRRATDPQRELRIGIWKETEDAVLNGRYINGRHSIPIRFDPNAVVKPYFGNTSTTTTSTARPTQAPPRALGYRRNAASMVEIRNIDCVQAACQLNEEGLSPILMDAGNRQRFGGGYRTGAIAQEEELCRRSSLAVVVEQNLRFRQHYPFPSPEFGLYVPNVSFFRHGPEKNYQWSFKPHEFAVGIVTAEDTPQLVTDPHDDRAYPRLSSRDEKTTQGAIRTFFQMAKENGHRSCVCVPLGCGAFKNPAMHIAELFMNVLASPEFVGCFDRVVFAVLDDRNAYHRHNPIGNFGAFGASAFRHLGGRPEFSTAVFNRSGHAMTYQDLDEHVRRNGGGQLPPASAFPSSSSSSTAAAGVRRETAAQPQTRNRAEPSIPPPQSQQNSRFQRVIPRSPSSTTTTPAAAPTRPFFWSRY